MKKLNYILFIIPLLFIYISNTKAYTFIENNGVSLDEQFIYNTLISRKPDFVFNSFNKVYCYAQYYSVGSTNQLNNLFCYFLDSSSSIDLSGYTGISINYSFNYPYYEIDIYNIQNGLSNISVSAYERNSGTIPFYTNWYSNPTRKIGYSSFDLDYTAVNGTTISYVLDFSFLQPEPEPEPEPEEPTIENKIYLPDELQTGNCPIILNQNVIRVYEEEPTLNTPVNYTDYFINSHYIKQTGIDNLSTSISCMDLDKFTTNYVYRFDFHQIIIIFLSIVIIVSYPLMKIIHAFFVGFKRR